MIITLRIKKKFYDLIKNGEKKVEYRERKQYYDSLFESPRKYQVLKLHYQGRVSLLVKIKQIKKTKHYYEIHLGRIIS